ncbi:MAG: hypothetical protein ACW99G_20240 [Candidatus Thorarchaeota archaeon]|jgi:hypothetical protein
MQIKVLAQTDEPVFVPGIGSLVPNKWTEISDEQVAQFEVAQGLPIQEASNVIEVKGTKPKKESE